MKITEQVENLKTTLDVQQNEINSLALKISDLKKFMGQMTTNRHVMLNYDDNISLVGLEIKNLEQRRAKLVCEYDTLTREWVAVCRICRG